MQEVKAAEQITLFGMMKVDDRLGQVFQAKDIKNKDGESVGSSLSLLSRKDIATNLGLKPGKKDKEALDAAMLEQQDVGMRQFKQALAGLGAEWTLGKLTVRTTASGVRTFSMQGREVKRNTGPTDEQIAKSLNWTVEQVRETRARQEKALATQTIEADSTVVKE